MKIKILIILTFAILSPFLSLSQIPQGLYDSIQDLSGEGLKTALHEIIKDHTEFPYTSSNMDVWDILKKTDRDTLNPDNVILFYSGWSVNAEQEYNSGNGWTREHVWAKSHGDFGTTMGAGTDIHHLRPADVTVNSARNNKDFDMGGEIYVDGDGTTECFSDADSWEPRDIVKGDVARMLFYIVVRYEGEDGEPDLELVDTVNSVDLNETDKGFHGKLSTLLQWHISDPVDDYERNRNDTIFIYQGNRNPFIDHPEYVSEIWAISVVEEIVQNRIKVYPNPARDYLIIEVETDYLSEGKMYSTIGITIINFEISGKMKLSISDTDPGIYFLRIVNPHEVFIQKVIVEDWIF
jgi:endonuclease I